MFDWLWQNSAVESLTQLPWQRFAQLHVGESIALVALAGVTFAGGVAALNRFMAGEFSWPKKPKADSGKKKRGFGLKHLVLLAIALLPGGMVGTFAVYAVMGKEFWRRDAFRIVGIALAPAALLLLLRAPFFPWPQWGESIHLSGILGVAFGVLQLWALIKLLREWIGEPDECVPWWPPLALWAQGTLLAAAVMGVLRW